MKKYRIAGIGNDFGYGIVSNSMYGRGTKPERLKRKLPDFEN